MIKKLFFALLLLPFIALAQTESSQSDGIHFENGLSWQQVLDKARKEDKYIFVDCYTTWCGPCKLMEKKIYPIAEVGKFYDQNFISVKLQMDKTSNDDELTKRWYNDAAKFAADYSVNAYPTFLFFSPAGKIVHRYAGVLDVSEFISLGKNAMDTAKQYYTLITKYHPENLSSLQMRRMADSLRYIGPELAKKIAVDYLEKLDSSELYSKENLSFLATFGELDKAQQTASNYIDHLKPKDLDSSFNRHFLESFIALVPAGKRLGEQYIEQLTAEELKKDDVRNFTIFFMLQGSSEVAFKKIYQYSKVINDAVHDGYAESLIASVISRKIVEPAIEKAKQKNEKPDWGGLSKKIIMKYGKNYSDQCLSFAKYQWYSYKKEKKQSMKWLSIYLMNYEYDALNINNQAWAIFLSSKDISELRQALIWSRRAIMLEPIGNWMDTYANILYKLGKTRQAIFYETQAAKLSPDEKSIQSALEKMNKGLPTWPESQ